MNMTIFKFALLRGIRSKDFLLTIILPLAAVFIAGAWTGDNPQGFHIMGFIYMFSAFSIAKGIFLDKSDGTIIRILAAPTNTLHYLSQNFLACMIPVTVQIAVIISALTLLYDLRLSFALYLFLGYTIYAMACVMFTFAWSCLFKKKENSNMAFSFVAMLMAFLGGAMIPSDFLPVPVRYFGAIFPTYWLSRGLDEILADGTSLTYWLSLGAIALFAVAYLLYGGKRRII